MGCDTLLDAVHLPHGHTAPGPGVYDTPINWYHSQGFAPDVSVSSSMLRKMWQDLKWGICPADLYDVEPSFNPDAPEPDEKPHFSLGSAVHTLALDMQTDAEAFAREYAVTPERVDYPQAVATVTDAKAALQEHAVPFKSNQPRPELLTLLRDNAPDVLIWDDFLADFRLRAFGKTLLTSDQFRQAQAMARNVVNEPIVRAGLLSGHVEKSLLWRDEETGLWVKNRADVIPDLGSICDLKSTAANLPSKREWAIRDHRYDMQLALGVMGARALLGVEVTQASLLFVGSGFPHRVTHHPVGEFTLRKAERMVRLGLRAIKRGMMTGDWPGYSHDLEFNMSEYDAACVDAVEVELPA